MFIPIRPSLFSLPPPLSITSPISGSCGIFSSRRLRLLVEFAEHLLNPLHEFGRWWDRRPRMAYQAQVYPAAVVPSTICSRFPDGDGAICIGRSATDLRRRLVPLGPRCQPSEQRDTHEADRDHSRAVQQKFGQVVLLLLETHR